MELLEHKDALHKEAGATVNYRVLPESAAGSPSASAPIPHFLGRFRVLGEIARGGMGIIVCAYDPALDRELAIKLLAPEIPADSEAGRRFAQEARIVSHFHHPGIIPVFEAGMVADGRAYFAMPFIEGQTLSVLLAERAGPAHGLARWLQVFLRVCETIAYVHEQGIVHRDLKPSNVMVGRFGEVMVMDWGVAALVVPPVPQPVENRSGCWVFGTPAYMPPEQALGTSGPPDRRADVFGLGAILCEILTGHPPYPGIDLAGVTRLAADGNQAEMTRRLVRCGADPALIQLARLCLSPAPADRPGSAGEVATAVTECLAAAHSRVQVAEHRTLAANAQRDRRFAGLVTAILALVASIAVGVSTRELRARGQDRAVSPEVAPALTPSHSPAHKDAPESTPRP
jgi:serine/threonine protein kinase